MLQLRNLCSETWELQAEPTAAAPEARAPSQSQWEAPTTEWPLRAATREKPTQQWGPSTAKNNRIIKKRQDTETRARNRCQTQFSGADTQVTGLSAELWPSPQEMGFYEVCVDLSGDYVPYWIEMSQFLSWGTLPSGDNANLLFCLQGNLCWNGWDLGLH